MKCQKLMKMAIADFLFFDNVIQNNFLVISIGGFLVSAQQVSLTRNNGNICQHVSTQFTHKCMENKFSDNK